MERRPTSARSRSLLESGIAIQGNAGLGAQQVLPPGGRPSSRGAGTPRPPTATATGDPQRQSSALRARQESGNRLKTAFQAMDRPVTGVGYTGTKRQVLDKSYFVTQIRAKRSDLHREIASLADEIATLERDKNRQSTLVREVRRQQGQLADLNLAWDNVRSQKSPNRVREEIVEVQERNAHQRQKIEMIFFEHNQNHSAVKEIELKIATLQREKEKRLRELAPSKREEYSKLMAKNEALKNEISQLKSEDLNIDSALDKLESQLKDNEMKEQALKLQEKLHQLQKERIDMEAEEACAVNDPDKVRGAVIEKLRQDKADITAAEEHIRELERAIAIQKGRLSSSKPDLASDKNEQHLRVEKVQELKSRESEMKTFVEDFEEKYRGTIEEIESIQQTIVEISEESSRRIALKATLPARAQFGAIKEELSYKQVQKDNAELTEKKLQLELRQRRSELEKIESLEEKIQLETKSLLAIQTKFEQEIAKFKDIAALERESLQRESRLRTDKENLEAHLPIARIQVDERAKRHSFLAAKVSESSLQKAIEKSQLILREALRDNFSSEQFIKQRLEQNDQSASLQECLSLVDRLNAYVPRAVSSSHVVTPG